MNIVNAIGWITFTGSAFFLGMLISTAFWTGDWVFGVLGILCGLIAVFTIRHWEPPKDEETKHG